MQATRGRTPRTRGAHALGFVGALLSMLGVVGCSRSSSSPPSDGDAGASVASGSAPEPSGSALVNATPVPTASVAAMVNPQGLPPYSGPTGSIEGAIAVVGDPAPATPADFKRCPDAESIWGHAFREGGPRSGPPSSDGGATRPLADAIVAVTGYKGFFVPERDEAETVTIEGCGFTRRTVTMTFGQRLDVKNDSNDFWLPKLEPNANPVMMMAAPHGDPVHLYPKKPGHYLLFDHDRKYAIIDVYVFLHPLHTTSDLRGHYRIDGVPVGKVTVNTRHPRIEGEVSVETTVQPGVVQQVDLTLKYATPPPAPDAGTSAETSTAKDAGSPRRPLVR